MGNTRLGSNYQRNIHLERNSSNGPFQKQTENGLHNLIPFDLKGEADLVL